MSGIEPTTKVVLDAPNLGEREKEYLCRCVDENFVSIVGPFVPQFEERFARYLGVPRAVSVQSGTAALHAALMECGVGPGDEVILPALSFVATANPILYVGAEPVFADVDPVTWNLDPAKVEAVLTPRTRVILPVHLYGNPCDMVPLTELADRAGIVVLEDAAESLGAVLGGRMTGTFGRMGCFSFNGNKVVTTGGGGMIVTNDETLGDHVKFFVNQARDATRGYWHDEIGWNYRMTNLEAALGLAQMERLEEFLAAKRRFADIYRAELAPFAEIRFQEELPGAKSSWWLPSFVWEREGGDIDVLRGLLAERGIPSRRIFGPMADFPYFVPYREGREFPVAERIYRRGLSLPASTLNGEREIRLVVSALRELLSGPGKRLEAE
jgi:perosamine synthetase